MNFIFDNDKPIYLQLVNTLKINIISGEFSPGDKIPSVREIASIAQVNPNTVQKALQELESIKLIYTERTNGKFVTNDKKLIDHYKIEQANYKLDKFIIDMNNIGYNYEEIINLLNERNK